MQAVTPESSYRPVILTSEHERSHSVLMTPVFDESEGLIYRIELWTEDDQHVDAVLAKCARLGVAYGAFEAAIAEYPGRDVTLRQRTRLLDGTSVRSRRSR